MPLTSLMLCVACEAKDIELVPGSHHTEQPISALDLLTLLHLLTRTKGSGAQGRRRGWSLTLTVAAPVLSHTVAGETNLGLIKEKPLRVTRQQPSW